MRVSNPDRSPAENLGMRLDSAQAPTGIVEIVSDDFPVFHHSECTRRLLQSKDADAYDLTVNQNVQPVGANPKRAGAKVVNVLTVVDLRRGQRPAGGKRGAVSASKALKIVQI